MRQLVNQWAARMFKFSAAATRIDSCEIKFCLTTVSQALKNGRFSATGDSTLTTYILFNYNPFVEIIKHQNTMEQKQYK